MVSADRRELKVPEQEEGRVEGEVGSTQGELPAKRRAASLLVSEPPIDSLSRSSRQPLSLLSAWQFHEGFV